MTLDKLSVLNISLVGMNKSLPVRFFFCTYTEMIPTQKKEDMTKIQLNKNIFYFELGSKPNVDIFGIEVYMWKQHDFEI